MIFRRFNIRIIAQVVFMALTSLLLMWSLYQEHLSVAPYTFGFLLVFQIIGLIGYIQHANKKLVRLAELIKNRGFMERFPETDTVGSQQQLHSMYNEIIQLIADAQIEKEGEHHYFQQALEIIGTSIVSFDQNGNIGLFNNAACELLNISRIRNIAEIGDASPELLKFLKRIKHNEKKLFKFHLDDGPLMLSVQCRIFVLREKEIKLISFQNISTELQGEELEAWQKLINVLRHEIMNSVAPVKSLTSTIIRMLSLNGQPRKTEEVTDATIADALTALHAIEKRNQGMLKFVESYRDLTKIPTPGFETISISDLFDSIRILMGEGLKAKNIKLTTFITPKNLKFYADEKLISQVMINLVKNSIDALEEKEGGVIEISASRPTDGETVIKITDNGTGIPAELAEKIFIPFFSTKTNGSGIGLSLSRQIMQLHKATINVQSSPDQGTTFTLKF